jgi:hypothetical protein
MPGPILHQGAGVNCAHGGTAQPAGTYPRVLVGTLPVRVQPFPELVAGCALPPPPVANGPCVSASWVTASVRVLAGGMPVVLADSLSLTAPSGTPLLVVSSQQQVVAT